MPDRQENLLFFAAGAVLGGLAARALFPAGPRTQPIPFPGGAAACSGQLVEVQPGDTIFILSQEFGVPVGSIIGANPQVPNPNELVPGDQICIPPA